MKFIFQILIILLIGIGSSFGASNMLTLHVGNQSGITGPDPCAGAALDLSTGCPLPMLGVF